MLHILYILSFTVLAFFAITNLIRNLLTLGAEAQRGPSNSGNSRFAAQGNSRSAPHPELLDEQGHVTNEPLLVMRSMTVEDAREQLDALYNSSPGSTEDGKD
ncbi:MAG: DUF2973 domain-containing protein [Cyanothece sp. SIO1E1]|nr:DUF2973 domain-containing protein [Cyanothece sp. SIO1E1]